MTAAHRWWIVGVVVLLLVASPMLVRAIPAEGEPVTATGLADRVQASRDEPFTAYGETAGNVLLPQDDSLDSLSKLLGTTNKVRVWWGDRHSWRVATLRTTGETDLVHRGDRMVRWVYESKRATVLPDVPVRLPQTTDLLPNELARHLLAGARAAELSRLPARRLAGRDALGLRLTPADAQAGVRRVDVYVDRATSVPLEVTLFAKGSRTASVTSAYSAFTPGRPEPSTLRFEPPPDARVRFDDVVDLAAAVNRFASRVPPTTLGGLRTRGRDRGSVGVYGRGPTVLLALPLWSRSAREVRKQLEKRPGVQTVDQGVLLGAPPLQLLLANPEPNGTSWLLAGTVTPDALAAAADELAGDRPDLRGQP